MNHETGALRWQAELSGHGAGEKHAYFNRAGDSFVTTDSNMKQAFVWKIDEDEYPRLDGILQHPHCSITAVYSPTGDMIVTGAFKPEVIVWERIGNGERPESQWKETARLKGFGERIKFVQFNRFGNKLIFSSIDTTSDTISSADRIRIGNVLSIFSLTNNEWKREHVFKMNHFLPERSFSSPCLPEFSAAEDQLAAIVMHNYRERRPNGVPYRHAETPLLKIWDLEPYRELTLSQYYLLTAIYEIRKLRRLIQIRAAYTDKEIALDPESKKRHVTTRDGIPLTEDQIVLDFESYPSAIRNHLILEYLNLKESVKEILKPYVQLPSSPVEIKSTPTDKHHRQERDHLVR